MSRHRRVIILSLLAAATAGASMAQTGTTSKTAAADKPIAAAKVTADLPAPPQTGGPVTLVLRGLDKITGRPTDIIAPIGKPVTFKTLTITARYCYSTPASETPETAAFLQIQDHRPDQSERRVFSGWMYASSPGLNGMEHPLYDVWVIDCRAGETPSLATVAASAPVKVKSPDSSDKEAPPVLPEGAGQ